MIWSDSTCMITSQSHVGFLKAHIATFSLKQSRRAKDTISLRISIIVYRALQPESP